MATRTINKLSATKVDSAKTPDGLHSDGGGLYLRVAKGGALKSWLYVFQFDGKRREMGLGAFKDVKLAEARVARDAARKDVLAGINPIERRRAVAAKTDEPTFAECVKAFLDSNENQWRNEKHRAQWRTTLGGEKKEDGSKNPGGHCGHLQQMRVSTITTDDVLKVLKPIWETKSETASRVRGRIERVLDYAKVHGWRDGMNPAMWQGHLKLAMPPRKKLTRGHHAAMPYTEVPKFVVKLRKLDALSARALELLILTGSRSGEVLNATWNEIDLTAKVWTVPAERMKAGRTHRVPLTNTAVSILEAMNDVRVNDFVYPGMKRNKPLSNLAMTMCMRRMKADKYTVHGFRSAFRDWAAEETDHPREVAEAALAHVVGDATERAYRRGDALQKRRLLMIDWENYITKA